jgi:hypothetical protein
MAYRIFQEAGAAEAAAVGAELNALSRRMLGRKALAFRPRSRCCSQLAGDVIPEPWRRDGAPGQMIILHAQSARWCCSSQLALWGGFACFSGCRKVKEGQANGAGWGD